jgi:hypothetical protein
MTDVRRWLPAMLLSLPLLAVSALPARAEEKDPLPEVKARLKVEAQRVEREFAAGRSAAYKLVRNGSPKLVEATEQLHTLLAMVRADTSLSNQRRQVLITTLKFDLGKVGEIAGERRRFARAEESIAKAIKSDARRRMESSDDGERRRTTGDAASIIESRGRSVADGRTARKNTSDRYNEAMISVDRSNVIVKGNVEFPRDWVEKSKKRGEAQKITAKEKAIIKALNTVISVDFDGHELQDVLDYLRKATGVDIVVDKRAMDEVSVTYKTPITLKLKGTTRTILKRMLSDLGMAYFVKSEAIQITSIERAKTETTTRTYYLGDLAGVTDVRMGPIFSQALMIQRVNQLINTITQTVEPKSWQVNNPDAVGTIVFNPLNMSLIVKQTAEIHYSIRPR